MNKDEVTRHESECRELLWAFVNGSYSNAECTELTFYRRDGRGENVQYRARRFDVDASSTLNLGKSIAARIVSRSLEQDVDLTHDNSIAGNKSADLKQLRWYDFGSSSDAVFITTLGDIADAYNSIENATFPQGSQQKLADVMDKANIQRAYLKSAGHEDVYAFARVPSQASLERKHKLMSVSGDTIRECSSDLLHVVHAPDVLICGEKVMVFNRGNFEFIFTYKKALSRFIDDNAETLLQSDVIGNSEDFIEACKRSNKRMQALKVFFLENRIQGVIDNRAKLEKVVKDYSLDIDIVDETIQYDKNRGAKHIDDILRLINKLCVADALTGTKMIAAEIRDPDVSSSLRQEQ